MIFPNPITQLVFDFTNSATLESTNANVFAMRFHCLKAEKRPVNDYAI
ncbi:MAG TPA: hypothetical protein VN454_04310 [Candidatus Angelobacter sp.]|nr:hypothetical protein [Candidatus Angelobacter sp.]